MHLLFAPRLDAPNGIDRSCGGDSLEIRRRIIDFSLTRNYAPEPKTGLLHDVIQIQAYVVRAMIGDCIAQEFPVFRHDGIKPGLDFEILHSTPPAWGLY